MPNFYSRYVPPVTKSTESAESSTRGAATNNAATSVARTPNKRSSNVRPSSPSKKRKLNEDTTTKIDTGTNGSTSREPTVPIGSQEVQKSERKETKQKKPKRKSDESHGNASAGIAPEATEEDRASRHSRVLSRFQNAKHKADLRPPELVKQVGTDFDEPAVHPDRAAIVNNLEPIPQPQQRQTTEARPKYSVEPEWLRKPIRVGQEARCKFKQLSLHKKLRKNLEAQQKEYALPVQAAVLPLLLDKHRHYRNDLCIAAATGSGKTLSYILPILNEVRSRKVVRLRAVVVVPTRALVKQVQQTIDSCSSGIDVRVGTAEGSRSLAEEKALLVDEVSVYNPVEYEKRQKAPIDWGSFSLDEVVDQAIKGDELKDFGHILEYNSKVDILICTPGRLIEHLQQTKGFNLDDVHWFVVDEADRLLNESYHEWLEVVLPALKSTQATESRDQLLRQIHAEVPAREVTKILLSATMTHDISQLLSLELRSPKLVVVQSETLTDEQAPSEEQAEYNLPPGLSEHTIALKDSENKPLYLLELLTKHIFKSMTEAELQHGLLHGDTKALLNIDAPETSSLSEVDDSDGSIHTDDDANASEHSSISDDTSSSKASKDLNPAKRKFLADLLLKHQRKLADQRVLIFTRSTESAHRLSRLLSILSPNLAPTIATFTKSSSTKSGQKISKDLNRSRAQILESFTAGKTRILVSTDLAARGLDIPELEHVINYDVPSSALTYVHRVGRTARAGLAGKAWTLLEHKQGKWFWDTIGGKAGNDEGKKAIGRGEKTIQKVNMSIDKEQWEEKYEAALKQLGEDVKGRAL